MYNYNPYQYGNSQQVIQVNGENGAHAYQMYANSSALLLDSNNPIVYLVVTDGAGYKTVTPYKIEPYVPDPEPDYKSLLERIGRLEEMINNGKSNSTENDGIPVK